MDGTTPPSAPTEQRKQDCTAQMGDAEVDKVFESIKQRLPRTQFTKAWAACMPGFVALGMADGSVAYTDKYARYFILGLVLDTTTGKALDRQLDGRNE